MIKHVITVFIVLSVMIPLQISAEGYLIKNRYQPNNIYNIHCKTETSSDINFVASEEMLKMLKEKGTTFPISSKSYLDISEIAETGKLKENNSFPIKVEFTDVTQTNVVNGVKKESPDSSNFKGTIISGIINENDTFTDVQITGSNAAVRYKELLSGLVSSLISQFQYPDSLVSINDSFTKEIPLQLPVPGTSPINIKLITVYTLKKIENDLAYFDTKYELEMTQQSSKYEVESHGGGKGTLIHDLKRNFFARHQSEMEIHLEVIFDQLKIVSNSVSKTDYSVK
ncbi:MAG: hypothetical protein HF300_11195 [Ignavibacteria bacterium]|jgi:hypothetical protein|nr:hypothetical protein [Ignavibacteria bacterium]MCU7500544.1 hypothetical protein [Ignavibacteria bacterium]MCU7513117.1 hypothetical protein [Ignavibacteria bacterium]MCU7521091.1 hypothetical protein [Ignavibacteria bacterium]MCU7524796.1 hypothetical protein [Ignavibacteria bacterium]